MAEKEYNPNDFMASEEVVEVEIGGFKYGIRQSTAKAENEMLRKVAKVDARTQKISIDVAASNEVKFLHNLVTAPFKYKNGEEWIEWEKCNDTQKLELFNKLKPSLHNKIIKEIDNVNGVDKNF